MLRVQCKSRDQRVKGFDAALLLRLNPVTHPRVAIPRCIPILAVDLCQPIKVLCAVLLCHSQQVARRFSAARDHLCGKEEGGKVTIRSRKSDGKILITVSDDGVGFDTSVTPCDGLLHIGLENVTQRLKTLCDGELIVDSAPGYGTVVTIVLPEKQDEETFE